MAIILALLGGLIAAESYGFVGVPFGLVGGYLFGAVIQQTRRLLHLEKEVAQLRQDQNLLVESFATYRAKQIDQSQLDIDQSSNPQASTPEVAATGSSSETEDELDEFDFDLTLPEDQPNPVPSQVKPAGIQPPSVKSEPLKAQDEIQHPLSSWADLLVEKVKSYFTTGNLIVRVGVIVLFFGVAFLVKFAADNSLLPIEFRLAGVALGGIVMLFLGWRLRNKQQSYALALQGGAIGVLYLTVFAALQLYALVPHSLAFALLLLFVASSVILALLQDSKTLALLATAGGFLAPVLTSSGEGNHVALFSYYLLLNGGLLSIAWFRSWRILNLVGFLFTYVIGALWGFQSYKPENYSTTEPFLIAFFLLYVAIAVLFATRQKPNLKGVVDGTLVFGVPLSTAALQGMLVRDIPFGLAFSAVAMGAFYILLSLVLFKRAGSQLRMLSESFLSTGVVFTTLAIPFALEGQLSAAFWALEGAAMVWVGIRQSRLLPRLFGCSLQLLAALLYIEDSFHAQSGMLLLNSQFLGATLIAFSGLFSSFYLEKHKEKIRRLESQFTLLLFIWGMVWWLGAVIQEIDRAVASPHQWAWFIAVLAVTGLISEYLKPRLEWARLQWVSLGLLPLLVLVSVGMFFDVGHPFAGWATLSWIGVLCVQYWILSHYQVHQAGWLKLWHGGSYWLMTFLLTVEAVWRVSETAAASITWGVVLSGMIPMLMGLLLLTLGRGLKWPVKRFYELYTFYVIAPMASYALAWMMYANAVIPGNAWPISYMPLLNPLDLTLFFGLLFLFKWWQLCEERITAIGIHKRHYYGMLGGALFLILNGMVVRTVHHWAAVPFDGSAMFESQTLQAAIAVLWGSIGLVSMMSGSRLGYRILWMVGAGMMGLVVAKLFLVDLSNTGTVARIVSFLGVGLLLLVVGYFSPAPPRKPDSEEEAL